jgi:hypothetical protein
MKFYNLEGELSELGSLFEQADSYLDLSGMRGSWFYLQPAGNDMGHE